MFGISLHSQILHWGPHELSACAGPTRVYYGIRLQLVLLQLVLLQKFTNHNTKAFEKHSQQQNSFMAIARSTSQGLAIQAHIAQPFSLFEERFWYTLALPASTFEALQP